jgi:hypothetical protein
MKSVYMYLIYFATLIINQSENFKTDNKIKFGVYLLYLIIIIIFVEKVYRIIEKEKLKEK